MSVNTSAVRVASVISVIKWLLIALSAMVGVLGLIGSITGVNSGIPAGAGLVICFSAVAYALVIWVLFGWFEHTLRLLASIAANTQQRW